MNRLLRSVIAFAAILLLSASLTYAHQAQQIGRTSATVTTQAPIFIEPGFHTPLRVAKVETTLIVLQVDGEWAQVEFRDPEFGVRTGWVQTKLIKIARPDLEPMDLSIKQDPAVEPRNVSSQQQTRPARDSAASTNPEQATAPIDAARPLSQSRRGFWFNVGLGYGTFGCQNCFERVDGLSGGLSLGGTINDKLLLAVGTTGWTKSEDGETLTVGTLDARLRFYPVRTSGFFVTGGVGVGSLSFGGESELGLGVILGLGWDIRVGRNVSLTPFWNGFAMNNSTTDFNVGQLGLGITIH